MQQSPVTLTFQSALMESEFGRWVAQHHCKVRLVAAPRGGCFCSRPRTPHALWAEMPARPPAHVPTQPILNC